MSSYQIESTGITFKVYVVAGASRQAFAGTFQQYLKIRIQARAIEGQANAQLCQFLASQFKVPKSSVSIKHGRDSRYKVIHISSQAPQIIERLQQLFSVVPEI